MAEIIAVVALQVRSLTFVSFVFKTLEIDKYTLALDMLVLVCTFMALLLVSSCWMVAHTLAKGGGSGFISI